MTKNLILCDIHLKEQYGTKMMRCTYENGVKSSDWNSFSSRVKKVGDRVVFEIFDEKLNVGLMKRGEFITDAIEVLNEIQKITASLESRRK